jgi:hypothetical protein
MAAFVGAVSAWYWYRSARVTYPPNLQGGWTFAGVDVSTRPLLEAVQESGRLNKIAAALTAGASGLVAISTLIGAFAR